MNSAHEAAAAELLARFGVPRRRARPRVAERLHDAEFREIETPAGSVATWRLGRSPAILLVHGWEDDNALWGPLIDRAEQSGRSVVAMDLPGHGHSAGERCLLPDASAAVLAVAESCGPVDAVIGHSYGCPSTGLALESGLNVDKVVFVAPPLALPGQVDRMVQRYGVIPEVEHLFRAGLPSLLGRPVEWFDLRRLAPAMTARALFVHSIDDEDCPFENSRALADLWPGSELLLTDGLGHRLIAQDDAIIERILDFVG